ncbi:MAG: tyrosine-type recombinase/integrase [Bacteroides sp.]|nr:tyrosine-type recombinase/integrase [Bacteroides sp.]
MAKAGLLTEALPITKSDLDRLRNGLEADGQYLWQLYAIIAFSTGLRVKDILSLTWKDIEKQNQIFKKESKTKKIRELSFSAKIHTSIWNLYEKLDKPDKNQLIFKSPQSDGAYTSRHINRIFQKAAVKYRLTISSKDFRTHSFRKGFGTHHYQNATDKEAMLHELMKTYQHSSPAITFSYIGITRQNIRNLYLSIEL